VEIYTIGHETCNAMRLTAPAICASVANKHQNCNSCVSLKRFKFQRELNLVRWHNIKLHTDSNEMCSSIINVFTHLKNTCTIENESSINSHKIDKPWIANKIKHCMNIRDKYFRMHKNNKNDKNYEELYKKHRNTVVTIYYYKLI
jgi:hypothetical protein